MRPVAQNVPTAFVSLSRKVQEAMVGTAFFGCVGLTCSSSSSSSSRGRRRFIDETCKRYRRRWPRRRRGGGDGGGGGEAEAAATEAAEVEKAREAEVAEEEEELYHLTEPSNVCNCEKTRDLTEECLWCFYSCNSVATVWLQCGSTVYAPGLAGLAMAHTVPGGGSASRDF